MEDLNGVQFLAHADELDGLAGDGLDGERGTAAGVAVQLGQHHTREVQRFVKGAGGIHRVLTDHGVHDQQNFVGVDRCLDVAQLVHQLLIHMEPAGRVQEHQVVAVLLGVCHRFLGDGHRVDLPHLEHRDVQLCAHHFQLLDGSGTVHVAGHQQRSAALLTPEEVGQLGGVGGLTSALETHHHDHRRRGVGVVELGSLAAHESGHLLVDDLDDHLRRSQRS